MPARSTTVTVRLTPALRAKLQAHATAQDRTVSSLCRRLLDDAIKRMPKLPQRPR
jgi:predicted transcriptional regulator